jgi:hypothetical protein
VLSKINVLERREIEVMIERPFTANDVAEWLFDKEVISIMQQAYGKLYSTYSLAHYVLFNENAPVRPRIKMDWDNLRMAAPGADLVKKNLNVGPVSACLSEMVSVHQKWNGVREVFNFLNEKGTLSAMRYYWPTILSLVPENYKLEATGERFKDIPNISGFLPRMRESTVTVASALLLPTDTAEKGKTISVAFVNPTATPNSQEFNLV